MARSSFLILLAAVQCGLTLLAYGCSTAPATVGEHIMCPPMVSYSAQDNADFLKAYQALPADSPLKKIVKDYEAMRDADRACLSGATDGNLRTQEFEQRQKG